ncbi:hypothetical protein IAU60_000494 [Kwoniella sp. DSM 27419]
MEDEVIIQSNDNIEFRVHRPRLLQASQFFSDLLSIPQPTAAGTGTPKATPIVLDYSSTAVSTFLDMCHVHRATVPILNVEEADELRELLQFTMCARLIPVGRQAIERAGQLEPKKYLICASRRDDVFMARKALSFFPGLVFSGERWLVMPKTFYRYLSELSPSFQLELLRQSLDAIAMANPPMMENVGRRIAERFDPYSTDFVNDYDKEKDDTETDDTEEDEQ